MLLERNILRGTGGARHGIDSALMKGMAAAQALQTHPDTASRAMYFNRFTHVLGARRIEPAGGGQKRGYQAFVPGKEEDEEFAERI